MALFGLIGSTKTLASAYQGQESASAKGARKRAGKAKKEAAARRTGHRRSIPRAAAAGDAWTEADRKRIG